MDAASDATDDHDDDENEDKADDDVENRHEVSPTNELLLTSNSLPKFHCIIPVDSMASTKFDVKAEKRTSCPAEPQMKLSVEKRTLTPGAVPDEQSTSSCQPGYSFQYFFHSRVMHMERLPPRAATRTQEQTIPDISLGIDLAAVLCAAPSDTGQLHFTFENFRLGL